MEETTAPDLAGEHIDQLGNPESKSIKYIRDFTTDEGHVILDVRVPKNEDIADVVARIRGHAGVVETGFFPTEATEAIIATSNGIRRMTR